MKIVTSDIDELPGDLPVIQTYNEVKKVFPAEGVTATVVMEVDDVTAGAPTAAIAEFMERVDALRLGPVPTGHGADRERGRDGGPDQRPDGRSGTDDASVDALNELRDEIIPRPWARSRGRAST